MTPRVFRWAIGLSWSLIGITLALIVGGIMLGRSAPPAWGAWVTAVAYLVALPVGIWSPVGLVFAHARAGEATRRLGSIGFALAGASLLVTLVVLTDGTGYMWSVLSRASLPVMLLTLAVALWAMASMTPSGPRAAWLLKSGVAAMFSTTALATGMVLVDSGNRLLFGVLAFLLAWAIVQVPVMAVLRRRARSVTGA